jgi:hypothetical protein
MLSLLCAFALCTSQEPEVLLQQPVALTPASGRVEQPEELGQVRWRRDFEAGLAEAESVEKPVLLLFQEVPG